jgi:hypothetical protein
MSLITTMRQRWNGLTYRGPSIDELYAQYASKGRIDSQAPIVAAYEIEVNAPVERVWEVLSNLEEWPSVHQEVSHVQNDEGVVPGAQFTWRNGRTTLSSRFAVVDQHHELTWTGTSMGAKAVHRHVLSEAHDEHTRLATEESMAGSLVALFFSSAKLEASLEQWLRAISAAAESKVH